MRRRTFIAGLGSASAWPVVAWGQQPTLPVIGFLNSGSPTQFAPLVAAFKRGLSDAGFVEGRNVTVEYRWAMGQYGLLSKLATDLVSRDVNVIAASGRHRQFCRRASAETITATSRVDTQCCRVRRYRRPNRHGLSIHHRRRAGRGAQARPATRYCECQQR